MLEINKFEVRVSDKHVTGNLLFIDINNSFKMVKTSINWNDGLKQNEFCII
jgi:hypothetical protein